MAGAQPRMVSERAKETTGQRDGHARSGNHYLEVQIVAEIFDVRSPRRSDFHRTMSSSLSIAVRAGWGIKSAPNSQGDGVGGKSVGHRLHRPRTRLRADQSEVGQRYLGAMRAAINCALANREILGHYARGVFRPFLPRSRAAAFVRRLAQHLQGRTARDRREATRTVRSPQGRDQGFWARARQPARRPSAPSASPCFIGGSMGTGSYILVGEGIRREQSVRVGMPRRRTCAVAPRRAQAVERTPKSSTILPSAVSSSAVLRCAASPRRRRARTRTWARSSPRPNKPASPDAWRACGR